MAYHTPGTVLTVGISTVSDKCHKAKQGKGDRMERSVRTGIAEDNLNRDLEPVRHTRSERRESLLGAESRQ